MRTYRVFVESGPKRKKTMVHVTGLLGCIAQGPTTEEALEATPEAIRAYATFLRVHGLGGLEPDVPFEVRVEQHVTEGMWLGNGDPSILFASDEVPVTAKDVHAWVARFEALRAATIALLEPLTPRALDAKPARGRAPGDVLRHVMGASPAYIRTFGPVTEMNRLAREAEKAPEAVRVLAAEQGEQIAERLHALTAADRKAVQRRGETGQNVWTARKTFRRLLEHEWEHHRELVERLA
ncbi:MAG: DinB family protein [Actinomycetota bacterium]